MVVCQGKSVLKGIAIGKIYLYEKQEYVLEQKQVADAEAEVARFEAAKETAIGQLDDLYEKALAEAGEEQAMIFDVHKMMLDDGERKGQCRICSAYHRRAVRSSICFHG